VQAQNIQTVEGAKKMEHIEKKEPEVRGMSLESIKKIQKDTKLSLVQKPGMI